MKMILKLLFISDFWLGTLNLNKTNHLKKGRSKELMPVAWHPTRWLGWCMSEDEKKEKDPNFTDEIGIKLGNGKS